MEAQSPADESPTNAGKTSKLQSFELRKFDALAGACDVCRRLG